MKPLYEYVIKPAGQRYNNSIKVDICPRCNGTGSLVNENDWKHNKGRRLIKG